MVESQQDLFFEALNVNLHDVGGPSDSCTCRVARRQLDRDRQFSLGVHFAAVIDMATPRIVVVHDQGGLFLPRPEGKIFKS